VKHRALPPDPQGAAAAFEHIDQRGVETLAVGAYSGHKLDHQFADFGRFLLHQSTAEHVDASSAKATKQKTAVA